MSTVMVQIEVVSGATVCGARDKIFNHVPGHGHPNFKSEWEEAEIRVSMEIRR